MIFASDLKSLFHPQPKGTYRETTLEKDWIGVTYKISGMREMPREMRDIPKRIP